MKLSDIKKEDLPLNGVPSLYANGKQMYLDIKHYESYMHQMFSRYGILDVVLVDGEDIVVMGEKYLLKQAQHHAYIQSDEYGDYIEEQKAIDQFMKGCKYTANA